MDNKYYSITVPTGYNGENIKQYEPASYSVALSKNKTVVLISVANYDVAKNSIEDCLISFITTNPQIAGKLNEMPTFNNSTLLGQPAVETQFDIQDNKVNAIGFRAKNGMFYYSTAFNISLEEHKIILNTLNIKETKVEYIDTETFFRTCYHGLVFNVNQYIDESILLESYELNPQNKELYINLKLESMSPTDINEEQLETFKSEIIDSFRPVIFEAMTFNKELFNRRMVQLYGIVIYLSLIQCIVITGFAHFIIIIIYGNAYAGAVSALRIIVWYSTFSYIGAIRDIWLLAYEKQSLLWRINIIGALLNVVLNIVFIPLWSINGAAFASLITQIVTNVILGFIIKPIRDNNKLLMEGINPKVLVDLMKNSIIKLREN